MVSPSASSSSRPDASTCTPSSGTRSSSMRLSRPSPGFMNAEGGTLLSGVTDSGEVFGSRKISKHLAGNSTPTASLSGSTTCWTRRSVPVAAAGVEFQFNEFPDGTICRVDVIPRTEPTYVRGRRDEASFYIRLNNATRLLNTAETVEYLRTRS